jgi:cob(I)alamin adenosyltransferase
MSIATQRGDGGETGLAGGIRVSKAHLRVEVYGTIDEVISAIGFARSICPVEEIALQSRAIQKELFAVGSAIATHPDSKKKASEISDEMVERLTDSVHRIEAIPGILADWSVPGEDPASAAYDVARTICRRMERLAVRLRDEEKYDFQPNAIRYLNRLSDLLWLFARQLEHAAGKTQDAKLRDESHPGPRWSRAW